ncbi:MAG: hypothetical protein ACOYNF_09530 [Rhodoferax sp.]
MRLLFSPLHLPLPRAGPPWPSRRVVAPMYPGLSDETACKACT